MFTAAKCTNCGGALEVDATHEAAICKHCGSPFIVEKAINNYNTTNVTNVNQNIVKNIYGREKEEDEDFELRGLTQLKLEDYDSAIAEFRKASEIAPQKAKHWLNLLRALTANFTHGETLLNGVILEGGANDGYVGAKAYEKFVALATESDYIAAQKDFDMDLRRDSSNMERLFIIGSFYIREKISRNFSVKTQSTYEQWYKEKVNLTDDDKLKVFLTIGCTLAKVSETSSSFNDILDTAMYNNMGTTKVLGTNEFYLIRGRYAPDNFTFELPDFFTKVKFEYAGNLKKVIFNSNVENVSGDYDCEEMDLNEFVKYHNKQAKVLFNGIKITKLTIPKAIDLQAHFNCMLVNVNMQGQQIGVGEKIFTKYSATFGGAKTISPKITIIGEMTGNWHKRWNEDQFGKKIKYTHIYDITNKKGNTETITKIKK